MKDFQTFRVLGRGGFGAVHACRKKNSGTIYAMKCINKKLVHFLSPPKAKLPSTLSSLCDTHTHSSVRQFLSVVGLNCLGCLARLCRSRSKARWTMLWRSATFSLCSSPSLSRTSSNLPSSRASAPASQPAPNLLCPSRPHGGETVEPSLCFVFVWCRYALQDDENLYLM